jgi:hypothetical protein
MPMLDAGCVQLSLADLTAGYGVGPTAYEEDPGEGGGESAA